MDWFHQNIIIQGFNLGLGFMLSILFVIGSVYVIGCILVYIWNKTG